MITNGSRPAGRRVASVGLALIAVVGLLWGLPAPAGAHSPDPVLAGGLFAQNADLRFRWGTGGTPPAAMRTAIKDAAAGSNASRKSKAPTFTYDAGGGNAVYYGLDVPCGLNGLACFRRDAPAWFGVWLRENGHRFDWGVLRWCEMNGDPNGCYDGQNVMLDELGHVLGLDHHVNFEDDSDYTDAVVQQYSRTKPGDGWDAHVYGRCDVATLQQQYDVASASTPYSTCLVLPTITTLRTSASSVVAGAMVTFTATLASDGAGRLDGNPMSGRVVVLQVRSGTTWSDVTTMGAGASSGSYTTSLTVRASADYRALYRKTAAEGALGSSSAVVSITVTSACTRSPCPQSIDPVDQ